MRRLAVALLSAAVVLGACGDDGDVGEADEGAATDTPQPSVTVAAPTATTAAPTTTTTPTTTTEATDPTVEPATTTTTAPPPSFDDVEVFLTPVVELDAPIAMAVRPGVDALYVAEREGRVQVLVGDDEEPRQVVDISADTTTDGERGLLGLAFSPDGDRLYLSYTGADGDNMLDELTLGEGPADVDLASRRTLLRVDHPRSNHNGGNLAFGPDGFLYYGLGDGGSSGDPDGNGQDTDTLLGSILRIEPRATGADPYAIPADNPFVGGGGRAEVYVYGVRNPWRFSFDRETGDLWVGDVGQNRIEEIDLLPAGSIAGANLGWDRLEGTQPFEGEAPPNAMPPVFEYEHDEGYSVTGGYVYRGAAIPGLRGAYLFADFGTAQVRALQVEGGEVVGERELGVGVDEGSLVSFGEDADGELYVISISGTVFRIDAAS